MAVQQIAPVICPNCRTQFTAPVENIIDGQDPAKKSALLQGQLNLVQCPQCGTVFTALVPVLYYDLEKELGKDKAQTALEIIKQNSALIDDADRGE
jgi:hypothetical protein